MNNNLNQIRKWVLELFMALIIAFVLWLANGVSELKSQNLDNRISEMETWVNDWYNVLRVPERDQNQDAQIREFRQRIERLEAWRDSIQEN